MKNTIVFIVFYVSTYVCHSQDIQPYKAQDIQIYQGQDIQEVKSQDIEGIKSQDIQEVKSQDIQGVKSQDIQEVKSQEIRQFNSRDIQEIHTGGVQQNNSSMPESSDNRKYENPGSGNIEIATLKSTGTTTETGKSSMKESSRGSTPEISSGYFGLYQYWVPGTSYVTPDYSNNQLVIHNSSGTGVLPGGIRINSDGTYIWNSSWDGKVLKGNWRNTGDSGYPIELIHAQEGKNWRVGKGDDGNIIIWDGSTWYNGKKVKK